MHEHCSHTYEQSRVQPDGVCDYCGKWWYCPVCHLGPGDLNIIQEELADVDAE